MSDRNASPETTIALVVVLVVGGGVLRLSMALGADFLPTLMAVGWTILVIVGFAVWLWFRFSYDEANWSTRISGLAALIWPSWWKAVDSIAANAEKPPGRRSLLAYADTVPWSDTFPVEFPWWASGWFYGLTEVALVATFLYALINAGRGYR
ncbi:hypothetical protein [Magnetospirillum sulfuroxidans]|uniref:Uncharacterized protein n=1 Tax=Magnetospirillum sulfuroxidans TaxID=611300 RepID=A0ABS5ICF8_9PROT|nr:hypothetical protein [Magnetospirillum sulfuroxidans]MBR9972111.1 hypothetical protein [Magnetospirillum sulfuroxidans]